MKRAVEIVYAATLPKASKPFIYMSIVLPPEHVDVNVHPTKREVHDSKSICFLFVSHGAQPRNGKDHKVIVL